MKSEIYEYLKRAIAKLNLPTVNEYQNWAGMLVALYKCDLLDKKEYGDLHRDVWRKHENLPAN
jgi:hypothetical protein